MYFTNIFNYLYFKILYGHTYVHSSGMMFWHVDIFVPYLTSRRVLRRSLSISRSSVELFSWSRRVPIPLRSKRLSVALLKSVMMEYFHTFLYFIYYIHIVNTGVIFLNPPQTWNERQSLVTDKNNSRLPEFSSHFYYH